jgi:plasmid stabilization system protein ParE
VTRAFWRHWTRPSTGPTRLYVRDIPAIKFAPTLTNLERIVRSISVHNALAAKKFGFLVIQTGESLSFFPERHPKVRQRPGIRRFIVMKYYKVFYRVQSESRTVEVLRCWDGRQESDPSL